MGVDRSFRADASVIIQPLAARTTTTMNPTWVVCPVACSHAAVSEQSWYSVSALAIARIHGARAREPRNRFHTASVKTIAAAMAHR